MKSTHLAVFMVLALAACGGDPPAGDTDTGAGADAAVVGDSGPPVDSGPRPDVGPVDGGTPTDTGTVADTGTPEVDAASDIDAFVDPCVAHTFVVTVVGDAYVFDGGAPNPTLTLCAGVTYMFDMAAVDASHPMALRRGMTVEAAIPGLVTTSYAVPMAMGMQPDNYECTVHHFGGDVVVP